MSNTPCASFLPAPARPLHRQRRSWLLRPVFSLLAALGGCGGGDDNNGPGGGADRAPPSVPQGFTATAQSATQVQLAWTASTDDGSGVAGYRIYRDGAATPVATVTSGTSHADTALTPSTQYRYTIAAFDNASPANESAQSAAATATTLQAVGQLKLTTQRAYPDLPVFDSPVFAVQAPGDGSTWYVVEQAGRIMAFDDADAVSSKRVFVDLTGPVQAGSERGLLGMAFHPEYPTTPLVYLSYTTSVGGQLVSRVASFEAISGGESLDPSTQVILLTVEQPADNHNGGHVAFGPDGFLYISFGDGGGSDDPWGTIGNGQNLQTLLGKILRIDVNGTQGSSNYRIPDGNPHAANPPCATGAGAQSCPEIFAYGFRNPWRFSFDRVDGDLWAGDVGEGVREEVNKVTVGGNYGWRCLEGTLERSTDCGPNAGVALPPMAEYTHELGISVTGGYVYRGQAAAAMRGRYIFGDFGNGRLWHIARDRAPTRAMTADSASETGLAIASFAEDAAGELYVVDYSGTLHRVRLSST